MPEFVEQHNLKSLRKEFAAQGVFYTDLALANMLKDIITNCIEKCDEVYDPTCGSGSLLSVFPDTVKKFGQELDYGQAEVARHRLTNCEIATGDTLANPAVGHKFRAIVANYPFSIKWHPELVEADDERFQAALCLPPQSKADYAFILHILNYLADDGCAAVLCFPGILYRGNREGKIRRWIVSQHIIQSVTLIEKGHFVDTNISTALIVFRKGIDLYKIKFSDLTSGKSVEIPCDQILADVDANLSPSSYMEPDMPPQPTTEDMLEIDKRGNEAMIKSIDDQLQLVALCHASGFGHDPVDLANEIIRHCQKFIEDYQNNRIV
jgi:hypothetical protein